VPPTSEKANLSGDNAFRQRAGTDDLHSLVTSGASTLLQGDARSPGTSIFVEPYVAIGILESIDGDIAERSTKLEGDDRPGQKNRRIAAAVFYG
jgi:hypothetical protein